MDDQFFEQVKRWEKNPGLAFDYWRSLADSVGKLIPALSAHVKQQEQIADKRRSRFSRSMRLTAGDRKGLTDYSKNRLCPLNISSEYPLETISYRAVWQIGELTRGIEVDRRLAEASGIEREDFIQAFSHEESLELRGLSMSWHFFASLLRVTQDRYGGFPFSVNVAEETSETLRRLSVNVAEETSETSSGLSAEKFISRSDWTRFLIVDQRGVVEAVRLNRWIELKTGKKKEFDGDQFSGFHERKAWWNTFREVTQREDSWFRRRLKDMWTRKGVVRFEEHAPQKGMIAFKRSFLAQEGYREPVKAEVHQSDKVATCTDQ